MYESLVSCLCVSRGKPEHVARALECFRVQTYEPRELVLVLETRPEQFATRKEIRARVADAGVRLLIIDATPALPLGTLRNLAVAAAAGHWVAQWDDDDFHAPERIERQMWAARERLAGACLLGRWTLHNERTGDAIVSSRRPWEGSLLCQRHLLQRHPYPPLARGEDTPVVRALLDHGRATLLDAPELYTYCFHGGNAWTEKHFNTLWHAAKREQELEKQHANE